MAVAKVAAEATDGEGLSMRLIDVHDEQIEGVADDVVVVGRRRAPGLLISADSDDEENGGAEREYVATRKHAVIRLEIMPDRLAKIMDRGLRLIALVYLFVVIVSTGELNGLFIDNNKSVFELTIANHTGEGAGYAILGVHADTDTDADAYDPRVTTSPPLFPPSEGDLLPTATLVGADIVHINQSFLLNSAVRDHYFSRVQLTSTHTCCSVWVNVYKATREDDVIIAGWMTALPLIPLSSTLNVQARRLIAIDGDPEVEDLVVAAYYYENATRDATRRAFGGLANAIRADSPYALNTLRIEIDARYGLSPTKTAVRGVLTVFELVNWAWYARRLRKAVDLLRPEHSLFHVLFFSTALLTTPWQALLNISPTSESFASDIALGFFAYRVHAIGVSIGIGVVCALCSAFKDASIGRCRMEVAAVAVIMIALDIWDCAASGQYTWRAPDSINAQPSLLAALCFSIVLAIRNLVLLFGGGCYGVCCLCTNFGIKHHVRNTPYYANHDRHVAWKLVRDTLSILAFSASVLTTPVASNSVPFLEFPIVVVLAYAFTPVFCTDTPHLAVNPVGCAQRAAWDAVAWEPAWFEWLAATPGTGTLYMFVTQREEEAFMALQDRSKAGVGKASFFNYERCLWALHFAAEVYNARPVGAQDAAAVAAAVAVVVRATAEVAAEGVEGGEANSVTPQASEEGFYTPRESPTSQKRSNTAPPQPAEPFMDIGGKCETSERVGYRILHVTIVRDVQFCLGTWRNKAVISFRGSANTQNWRDDFRVTRVAWEHMPSDNLTHRGFVQIWAEICPVLNPLIEELLVPLGTRELMVCGHSLGGAIATLCAYYLQTRVPRHWNAVELWTFGSPYAGNDAFQRYMDAEVPHHYRVVNDHDLVTRTQFTLFSKHCGRRVHMESRCGMVAVDPPWVERAYSTKPCCINAGLSHMIAGYKAAITNAYLLLRDFSQHEHDVVPRWTNPAAAGGLQDVYNGDVAAADDNLLGDKDLDGSEVVELQLTAPPPPLTEPPPYRMQRSSGRDVEGGQGYEMLE